MSRRNSLPVLEKENSSRHRRKTLSSYYEMLHTLVFLYRLALLCRKWLLCQSGFSLHTCIWQNGTYLYCVLLTTVELCHKEAHELERKRRGELAALELFS